MIRSLSLPSPATEQPWRLSVADVEAMVEAGILSEDDRVELIAGELVAMSARNIRHELVKNRLAILMNRLLPSPFEAWVESTVWLSPDTFVEPDITVLPVRTGMSRIAGPDCALIIEVADASLPYDSQRKAPLYARFGVTEFWLIDVRANRVSVHRAPEPSGFTDITTHAATAILNPVALPTLAIPLSDILS
jgi:Uma2 family endonuclease